MGSNFKYHHINKKNFSDKTIADIEQVQSGILDDDMYNNTFWYKMIKESIASYIVYDDNNNQYYLML
jgi:hypothetical protein